MSGFILRVSMCILNKDSEGQILYEVRDSKRCNYNKSGDISNVSWIHDDD